MGKHVDLGRHREAPLVLVQRDLRRTCVHAQEEEQVLGQSVTHLLLDPVPRPIHHPKGDVHSPRATCLSKRKTME